MARLDGPTPSDLGVSFPRLDHRGPPRRSFRLLLLPPSRIARIAVRFLHSKNSCETVHTQSAPAEILNTLRLSEMEDLLWVVLLWLRIKN
jgi:hypothetical protein